MLAGNPGCIQRWHGVVRAARWEPGLYCFQRAPVRISSGPGPGGRTRRTGGVAATGPAKWARPPIRCQFSDTSLPGWCLRQREEDRDGAATWTLAWRHRLRRCMRRRQAIAQPADREPLPRRGADWCPWHRCRRNLKSDQLTAGRAVVSIRLPTTHRAIVPFSESPRPNELICARSHVRDAPPETRAESAIWRYVAFRSRSHNTSARSSSRPRAARMWPAASWLAGPGLVVVAAEWSTTGVRAAWAGPGRGMAVTRRGAYSPRRRWPVPAPGFGVAGPARAGPHGSGAQINALTAQAGRRR
jgi:hypothetical protein